MNEYKNKICSASNIDDLAKLINQYFYSKYYYIDFDQYRQVQYILKNDKKEFTQKYSIELKKDRLTFYLFTSKPIM